MIRLLIVFGVVAVSNNVIAASCTDTSVICLNGQIQNGDVLKVDNYSAQLANSAQHLIDVSGAVKKLSLTSPDMKMTYSVFDLNTILTAVTVQNSATLDVTNGAYIYEIISGNNTQIRPTGDQNAFYIDNAVFNLKNTTVTVNADLKRLGIFYNNPSTFKLEAGATAGIVDSTINTDAVLFYARNSNINFNNTTANYGQAAHLLGATLTISGKSMLNAKSYGFVLEDGPNTRINTISFVDSALNYTGVGSVAAFKVETNSTKDNEISLSNAKISNYSYLLYSPDAQNKTTINISDSSTAAGTVSVDSKNTAVASQAAINIDNATWMGNGVAKGNALLSVNLNKGGTWIGAAQTQADNGVTGTAEINVNGGIWNATRDSLANKLTIGIGGVVNLQGHNALIDAIDNKALMTVSNDAGQLSSVTVTGNMVNSGVVAINNNKLTGQRYTQNGDWVGRSGQVTMNARLNSDNNSQTDKLVITGHASGKTYVTVNNQGGSGGQTLEGIELINTASSDNGAFEQKGRIIAGSYDYYLRQGTKSGMNMNSWFLSSALGDKDKIYRPERGSYASNLAAAGTLFDMRLSDRKGQSELIDPVTGERKKSNLWGYVSGGHNESTMSDGQSENTGNRTVFRVGGDLIKGRFSGSDAWYVGVMAAYGKHDNKTDNVVSGYSSRGDVSGFSPGIYGTWYQNGNSRDGAYVDLWAQYSWFTNKVNSDAVGEDKYHSEGLGLSAEAGYSIKAATFATRDGQENHLYIRPQAQVRWSGIKADKHTETNGTLIESTGVNNIQTRLGMKVSLLRQDVSDKRSYLPFEPFVEVNWINNSKKYGVLINGEEDDLNGSRNLAEIKVGAEGRFTDKLSMWVNLSHQLGGQHYQDTQGALGFRLRF